MDSKEAFLLSFKLRVPIYLPDYSGGLEWLEGDLVDREWILGYFSTLPLAESIKEKLLKKISPMKHTFEAEISDGFMIRETFSLPQLMTFNITPITERSQISKSQFFIEDECPLVLDSFYPTTMATRLSHRIIPLEKIDEYLEGRRL